MLRPWLGVALKAAVTLSLIGWLLQRIDLAPVLERFGRVDLSFVAAAIAVMMAQLLLTAWRWSLVSRNVAAAMDCGAITRLTLIGQFFSQTLPSAIGGDAVRAWLATREGIALGKAIGGVLVDRVVALLVLVAIVGGTLPLLYVRVADPGLRGGLTVLVIGTTISVFIFFRCGPRIERYLERYRLTRPLANLGRDTRRTLAASPDAVAILLIAVAVHLGVVVGAWLVALALNIQIGLVDCLVLIPPVVLLTILPISIAGWGVREGAMVVGFGSLGVAAADALALSVGFGLVQIAIGLPGGLLWLAARQQRPGPTAPP